MGAVEERFSLLYDKYASYPEYIRIIQYIEQWLIECIEADQSFPSIQACKMEVIRCLEAIKEENS